MSTSLGTLKTFRPASIVKVPTGEIFIANGVDKIKRWDGLTAAFENAGIPAGGTALTLGSSGAGALTGTYYAYYRYVDDEGIPGNLSTISAVHSPVNKAQFDYTSIPSANPDPRITQVQIFRNTSGQTTTFYLDATVNIGTTTATSTNSDTALALLTALPLFNADGSLFANRFGVPPDHKSVMAFSHDRMFYAVSPTYDQGHVALTNGSATVTGIGTGWTTNMAGRFFRVPGHATEYTISAVASATSMTLTVVYSGSTDLFSQYGIAPDKDTVNVCYYSEINEPESVPSTQNTLIIQEDTESDDLVSGLLPYGSYLYILKERHLYRLSFVSDPLTDGAVQLVASRGCINQRCWVTVEDTVYLMDWHGIWAFNGGQVQAITLPIQDMWRDAGICWANRKWFWAEKDATEEVVRFYCSVNSSYLPKDAICYNYRLNRWWIESYPREYGHGCQGSVDGKATLMLGGEHRRVWMPSGTIDGLTLKPLRASVTTATYLTIADSTQTFTSAAVGCPVSIVAGKGKGQTRKVVSISGSTLKVDRPFIVKPASSGDNQSTYQLGGIPWRARIGKFQLPAQESGPRREVAVFFRPTTNAGSLDIRFFRGYDQTAEDAGISQTSGLLTTKKDDPDRTVDLKYDRGTDRGKNAGYERCDFSEGEDHRDPHDRAMSIELRGVQGVDRVSVQKITVEGMA